VGDAWRYAPRETRIVLEPGAVSEVTVELDQGSRVSGSVVDSRGEPVPDATVLVEVVQPGTEPPDEASGKARLSPEFLEHIGLPRARTDEHGNFELRGLTPGTWRLAAKAKDHLDGCFEPLRISTESAVVTGIKITLGIATTIRGRILGDEAAILELKENQSRWYSPVQVEPCGQDGYKGWGWVDDTGLFTVRGVPPGTYDLRVTISQKQAVVRIEVPEDTPEIWRDVYLVPKESGARGPQEGSR
jgi:hypothetical protein